MGADALERLGKLRVAIFGVGGVGSVCAESLVRSGVGHLTLVDSDCVEESNINRQLPAMISTIGRSKVDVLAEHFADINPEAEIVPVQALYSMADRDQFNFANFDVVVDAIDSLAHKIDLLATASEAGCQVFCSLGAAGKLDPTQVRTASIWETSGCPLGKLVRNGLRKRDFKGDFQAVYSLEKNIKTSDLGSAMPVTAAFGLALSSLVIRSVLPPEN